MLIQEQLSTAKSEEPSWHSTISSSVSWRRALAAEWRAGLPFTESLAFASSVAEGHGLWPHTQFLRGAEGRKD